MKRARSVDGGSGEKRRRIDSGDEGDRRRGGSEPPVLPAPPSLLFEGFDPTDYIKVERKRTLRWRFGPVTRTVYVLKLIKELPPSSGLERQVIISKLMEASFRKILDKAPKSATAQLVIENSKFNKGVVATCITKAKKITFHHISDRIDSILSSDEHVDLLESNISLTTFGTANVGYYKKMSNRKIHDQTAFLMTCKRSTYNPTNYIKVKNYKNLCVPLVIARELYAMDPNRQGRLGNYLATKAAIVRAKELVKQCGLQPELGPFKFEQLSEFTKCLPNDVSLRFFTADAPPVINIERPGNRAINIALAYNTTEDGTSSFHAHGIVNLRAFMGSHKPLCLACFKIDHSRKYSTHKCSKAVCKLCKYLKCQNRETERNQANLQLCENCETFMPTPQCLAAHEPECDASSRCGKCKVPIAYKSSHSCVKHVCSTCLKSHSPLEFCYVSGDPPFNVTKRRAVWYADSETQVDPASGEHNVCLIILQKSNGREYHEYKGLNAMMDFTKDCIADKSVFKKSYIVFHNASGFDAHLWWRELIRVSAPPKSIRRRGQRILTMELAQNDIICRDSLLYIPSTPLSAFPEMFGLDSGNKGDFPHGLSTPEWVRFDGSGKRVYREVIDGKEHRFPPLKYFWPEKKHTKELKKLKVWHSEQATKFEADPGLKYCPEDQLITYCRQDVRILRMGFEKYRKTWLDQYPTMEILNSTTLPSHNNAVLRNFCLPEKSLGLIPPEGWDGGARPYSAKSMAWLSYIEWKEGLVGMRNARKGGECRVTRHFVDGVARLGDTLHVLNFHGCKWHAHPHQVCGMRNENSEPELARARQLRTALTDKDLSELETSQLYGPTRYRTIYECVFDRQCKNDPEMKAFVNDYIKKYEDAGDPLVPREALRGGRTNAIKFRIDPVPDDHTMAYVDFTSLYPSINASVNGERWPIGYPDIYIGKDLDRAPKKWFGLAKVQILPPRGLKHPVLGQTFGERVMFHLCSECAENQIKGPCNHSEEERMIYGSFFTGEIDLAIEMGYKLITVYELWHWTETSTDLFRSFIAQQYKNKVIASKKPEDPTELLQDLASLGIEVDDDEWCENSAMRVQAKGSINNVWGFMACRQDYEHTEVVKSLGRLQELEGDKNNQLVRVELSEDEESLFVITKPNRETAGRKHNIVVGILTTAYARMALYQVIREYPDEVVYFDTDSLFLLIPNHKVPPKTSNKLGGLKDEILEKYGKGAKISSFTSIGPKSYTYTVEKDGVVVGEEVRLKGLKLTEETEKLLTPANLAALAPDNQDPAQDPNQNTPTSISVPQHIIKRDLFKTSLRNVELIKHVRFNCTKRWLKPGDNPQLDTLPFGY